MMSRPRAGLNKRKTPVLRHFFCSRRLLPGLAILVLATASSGALAQVGPPMPDGVDATPPAEAIVPERTEYDDWVRECITPPDSLKRCLIGQTMAIGDSDLRVNLSAAYLPASATAVMRVVVPLGAFLPAGVAVNVDGEQVVRTGYETCQPQGCVISFALNEEILNKLKSGGQAEIVFQDLARQNVGVEASLIGFTAAFNALSE